MWWHAALEGQISVPLAPRLHFPSLSESGSAFLFTDAAREPGTGHGGLTMIRTSSQLLFLYMNPRWPEPIRIALHENELSMPAGEGIGAVVFADALCDALEGLRHLEIFTDSTAVVAAVQSSNSESPQLNCIVGWLFERRPHLQMVALHQPGKRNNAADRLSRHDTAAVLAEAEAAGATTARIGDPANTEALARLALAMPQRA